MADVFLARDQLLDRPVAVKVLFPQFASDPTFVERFRREAQSAANLSHPNIVGVYDWGREGDTYFIVMEYVEGRSLSDVLRTGGPLHPDRAADIAMQVAAALSFAHRSGLVHRDIKPGNVMITPDGQVKVADFGIATAIAGEGQNDLTRTGAVMGTASYFSPEQAQGQQVGPSTDLYALGVVLYEMLVGRPPFQGDTPVAVAYKHVQEQPLTPTQADVQVPPPLEAITMKLLAKNPADRYPSAEDLRLDLQRYREGQPVSAPPPAAAAAGGAVVAAAATGAATAAMAPLPPGYDPGTVVYAPPPDKSGERRRSGLFVVSLAVLLALLAVLVVVFLRLVNEDETPTAASTDAEQVDVPSVFQLEEAEAIRQLESLGLLTEVQRMENATVAEGIVFDQDPRAGTKVDQGAVVLLTVSGGAEAKPVPGVVGQLAVDAQRILSEQGFESQLVEVDDDAAPRSQVVGQAPEAGAQEKPGTVVTLSISVGPPIVPVPDVAGQSPEAARLTLEETGFQVFDQPEPSSSVAEGFVTRTDPAAGVELEKGQRVTMFVSTGIDTAFVPGVIGAAPDAAIGAIQAAGFGVQQFDTPAEPGETPGTVVAQDPPEGTELPVGSTVNIWVAVEPDVPTPEPTTDPSTEPTVDPQVPPGPPPSSSDDG
jgi:beta-lactam-binding protein with PASTA domain